MRSPQEIRLQIVRFLVPSFWKDDHPRHVPFAAAIFFREGKCLLLRTLQHAKHFRNFLRSIPISICSGVDWRKNLRGEIAAIEFEETLQKSSNPQKKRGLKSPPGSPRCAAPTLFLRDAKQEPSVEAIQEAGFVPLHSGFLFSICKNERSPQTLSSNHDFFEGDRIAGRKIQIFGFSPRWIVGLLDQVAKNRKQNDPDFNFILALYGTVGGT